MKSKIKLSKFFILLMLFSSAVFGCAICSIYAPPETQVIIEVQADDKKIKDAEMTWAFSKEFTDQLKQIYDKNQDDTLDKDELIPIYKSIVDYIEEKNYLLHISYGRDIDKETSKKVNIKSAKAFMDNSLLHFNYVVELNYDVVKDNALYIDISDDENYFVLALAKDGVKFNAPFEHQKILDTKNVILYLNSTISKDKMMQLLNFQKSVQENNQTQQIVPKKDVQEESLVVSFSKKVKEYLVKIDNGDNIALFILLGVSFLYGIIHAIGPGHGKSLAFSYFASNKSSFAKAFWVSQASAFIHIIGALLLVVVSVFVLESMLNNFVNDSVEVLTKISAVMIMLLAAYILYNKARKKDCSCSSCSHGHSHEHEHNHGHEHNTPKWSATKPQKSSILKPNFVKKDLYFVLTAGLIPCPGTVVLFIYAFVLKTYFAVLLASIFISFGMGLVIFASSFLGVSVHNLSERSHKLTNAVEILAPIVMFILGAFLFLNAGIF